jgi:hypothetical protein
MKIKLFIISITLFFISCSNKRTNEKLKSAESVKLTLNDAEKLAQLPLKCIDKEYPNKLGQVLNNDKELLPPSKLHPIFYGCFDWHSAVHGHWSLVKLIKTYPNLKQADTIKKLLLNRITPENIQQEIAYFDIPNNKNYERAYGWAWLFQLATELHTWNEPFAKDLEKYLQPLTNLITEKFMEYLPKLKYPIRVGTHTNTAFAMSFAYDYAIATDNYELKNLIIKRAKDYFINDTNCPINWEPSGHDFFSPCLQEIDLMRKVLPEPEFKKWLNSFLPEITKPNFSLKPGEVTDRKDGHLVHLDGLNFSRAWVFYRLANQYEEYKHLTTIANQHIQYSYQNLVNDSYEGGHWLGSFAIYALAP